MENSKNIRKHLRFKPDYGSFCFIDLDENREEFISTASAFIVNESKRGCNIIVHESVALKVGDKCRLKLGKLHPLRAVVCRHKILDDKVVSLGMQLLE
ncbi:MAG: hypothetical protein ACUZ8H_15055 [Candidatus Anammoxibacter sp.]